MLAKFCYMQKSRIESTPLEHTASLESEVCVCVCVCVCVLVSQSCLTLCEAVSPAGSPSSPPGSSVYGILQARIPEWVSIPFFRGSSLPKDRIWVPCIADRQCLLCSNIIFWFSVLKPGRAWVMWFIHVLSCQSCSSVYFQLGNVFPRKDFFKKAKALGLCPQNNSPGL